ncbi:hypothetical protein BASA50_005306 [Batrachochytrium salamandrivorans]|uniref:Uncharacterized protein n=1 Tax=Batrachochytrium salamandrivorans TaxID=1357716 RepID=A0ABQ8FD94_9FUNG|nr:hypothetical protein BASA50_005306 [Batrachochytrium salamandrivorans]
MASASAEVGYNSDKVGGPCEYEGISFLPQRIGDPTQVLAANSKLENDIPESLIESPQPESLASLDKRMDDLLEDIKTLIDSRNKEFQISGESRARMPLLPSIMKFDMYKALRKENIEGLLKVEMPSRKLSSSEVIQKETLQYWNVERHFEGGRHLSLLMDFFKEKSERYLQENQLLISRWSRFCRTSNDIVQFAPEFMKRHEYLRREFSDSVNRYERLYEVHQTHIQKQRTDLAAEESARIDGERRGLAVLKPKVSETKPKDERLKDSDVLEDMSFFGAHEIPPNPGFDISDMTIYLRWLISTEKERRDMTMFLLRGKVTIHHDIEILLRDYRILNELKPGDDIEISLNHLDGLNGYIDQPPIKNPKVEDFLAEYDILVAYWKVDTQINQEDGRPFAYEVDHKFFNNFTEQIMETSLAPYETIENSYDTKENVDNAHPSKFSGNSGLDSFVSTLAGISGYTHKSNTKLSAKFPKLRRATWLNRVILVPTVDPKQESDIYKLSQITNIDMELRLEHDMLLSSDHEYVGNQLKDAAKRIWEQAAAIPNSCPMNTKISIIPQQREYKPASESKENRIPKVFDYGLKLPTDGGDILESNILLSKKKEYGTILKTNEDNQKINLELFNFNQDQTVEGSNIIKPTLATLFAEHEVFAYLQLRFIKIREMRIKLLRQFNFLRSVERKLNLDVEALGTFEPTTSSKTIAQMWRRAEFVDVGSPADKFQDPTSSNKASADLFLERENRTMVNGKIQIYDSKGIPFVYDVAFADLEKFDQDMLKIGTIFINQNSANGHVDSKYLDEMRFRMSNRRQESSCATYLNPQADRSQIILEIYEAQVQYLYSKIELINSYLEGLEHTTDIGNIKELAQIITNIIHAKPDIDIESSYFSKAYTCSTKALRLQTRLVINCARYILTTQRDWSDRFTPNAMASPTTPTSADFEMPKSSSVSTPLSEVHCKERRNSKIPSDGSKLFGTKFSSILNLGLPMSPDMTSETIVMHHPEISVQLTEVTPALGLITHIWNLIQSLSNDMCTTVDKLSPGKSSSKSIADCVVLKTLNDYWDTMADMRFQLPARIRRMIGGFDSNVWLQNPYLPDALLNEFYVPYDQTDEGTYKSLGIQLCALSFYTDASFQPDGREILYRMYKVLILRSRLWRVWIESENWRNAYDAQFSQMKISKRGYSGRLSALRFETEPSFLSSADDYTEQDDADEDCAGGRDNLNDSETDPSIANTNIELLRFGPLAIAELDESQLHFDLSTIQGITSLMRPSGIFRLKQGIKIQFLDKSWFMAAAELHSMVLEEIHSNILNCPKSQQLETIQPSRPMSGKKLDTPSEQPHYDIDYRTLVVSNLSKKKYLRRTIVFEYSKEYQLLTKKDITDNQKEQALVKFKAKLIDWYLANFSEVVSEECERLQEYGADMEKHKYKQSIQTQEVVSNEVGGGTEKLARLWHLPHLTEIILAMGGPDKPHKGPVDLAHRIYRNKQIFFKSTKIHSLIYELYSLISVFSHLLHDNRRYSTSVKQMREADYTVSTMNMIRQDLMNQGEPADYLRVQSFLSSKWQFWYLKLKYALSFSMHTLDMKMLSHDRTILATHYDKCITKKFTHMRAPKQGKYAKPLYNTKDEFIVIRTHIPTQYVFCGLSSNAKQNCDSNIQDIEDSIEEFHQGIQYSGSDDDKSKGLIDFLASNIKLLALRREYFKIITNGKLFQNEASQAIFFQKFKIRIIVPSIRMYHKAGSKGTLLLSDDVITGRSLREFNRTSRTMFDKCQATTLQAEIIKDYTYKVAQEAHIYFDQLTDERLGKLFKNNETASITSLTYASEFLFQISEQDYNTKSAIFNSFLSDLHRGNADFLRDLKEKLFLSTSVKSAKNQQRIDESQLASVFDDKRTFSCNKEYLGQTIVRFATHLNQWKIDRISEQEGFIGALYGHLLDTIRNCENIILFQAQEKADMMINFKREARLIGHELALDAHNELTRTSVELNELRKNRKVDEHKLRGRIMNEYDGLVLELVKEIGVLRHRFHEYQIGNLNDVTSLIAEAKKEQLMIMTKNEDLPQSLRATADLMIQHEIDLSSLRDQNHELKMTILKLRSMFSMKEFASKCTFDRQHQKLADRNKEAEEKLWDTYRHSEARDRTLRQQMTKIQKSRSTIEFQNEVLQRQLHEEQAKPRTAPLLKNAPGAAPLTSDRSLSKSARSDRDRTDGKPQKLTELEDRLRRYEEINIDKLMKELANKTALLEDMVQEKRDRDSSLRPINSMHQPNSQSKSHISTSQDTFASQSVGNDHERPNSVTRDEEFISAATAAEPCSTQDTLPAEFNSQIVDQFQSLIRENKALRRKLFLNGISLPLESRTTTSFGLGFSTSYYDSSISTCVVNSHAASHKRPQTAAAATRNTASRRSAGILRSSTTGKIGTSDLLGAIGSGKHPHNGTILSDLPPLGRPLVYQRACSGKQVGFQKSNASPESIATTHLTPLPPDTGIPKNPRHGNLDDKRRPQTAPLGRQVSFHR